MNPAVLGSAACSDVVKDTDTIGTSASIAINKDDTDDFLHIAQKFVAGYSYSATKVLVYIQKSGTPGGTLTLNLCDDNAGNPYANGSAQCTAANSITEGDLVGTDVQEYTFTLTASKTITATNTYWIKLSASELGGATTDLWYTRRDSDGSSGLGVKGDADDSGAWPTRDADSGARFDVIACE